MLAVGGAVGAESSVQEMDCRARSRTWRGVRTSMADLLN